MFRCKINEKTKIIYEIFTLPWYFRLQTIYRLAHGGRSYKIDIYLRNWSIRTELKRRAYLYNIENDSLHQPELSMPTAGRLRNDSSLPTSSSPSPSPSPAMMTPHQLNLTNRQQHHGVEIYQNSSNDDPNRRDHEQNTNQQDSSYQKQYCNELKTTQPDIGHTNGVNIASLTEINTTARKPIDRHIHDTDAMKIICDKNEVIVDRCGTWTKSIRNCSERKAIEDAKSAKLPTASCATSIAAETVKKPYKMCPFNPLAKCEIGRANKTPNLKTQNTFISRLFLTDIFDNI